MKTVMKIEIALLVLVLIVAAGMILYSEGVFDLFREPEIAQWEAAPIPTEPPVEAVIPEGTPILPEEASKPVPDRELTARNYFAYDLRQGEYLLKQGEGDARLYPASITKLLTCYVVLQHMDPEETVKVGDALQLVQYDSSVAGLEEGDELTVEQLIAAMLLPSGNDAAQVAAVAVGRKLSGESTPYEEAAALFVKEMNNQAKELGLTGSHFANPDGFHHDNHYTTMNDLVRLCYVALTEPLFLRYVGTRETTVELSGRTLNWKNTNVFLHDASEMHISYAIGMKTGYTEKAGNCLLSAFFAQDRVLLIGVFGCPAFTEDRYYDTMAIYNSL